MDAQQIKNMIAAGLACDHLELDGDGQHWTALIVSSAFEGLRAVARHQRVYAALGGKVDSGEVHALSMQTYTPAEWSALGAK